MMNLKEKLIKIADEVVIIGIFNTFKEEIPLQEI